MKAVICPVCNGTGKLADTASTGGADKVCHGCGGKGWVEVHNDYHYYPIYPIYPAPLPWQPPTQPWDTQPWKPDIIWHTT